MSYAGSFKGPQTTAKAGANGKARTPTPGKVTRTSKLAPVQTKRGAGNAEANADASAAASTSAGAGRPLPEAVQAKMGRAFGTDFSAVRVHEGAQAENLGALAYTQGSDIHFAPGQYAPESHSGQELLGHELAHVVQQSQGRVQSTTQAKGVAINDDGGLEREADEWGARAARGEPAGPGAALAQRKSDPSLAGAGAAAVQRKQGVIQAKTVRVVNVQALADRIHEAIDGLGTDEEAVYSALSALQHDADNIKGLRDAYQSKFGCSLDDDIRGDFSGDELSHALSLLAAKSAPAAGGAGAGDAAAGGGKAAAGLDYVALAKDIHEAVAGAGTDEEAVFAALSRLGGDRVKAAQLSGAYVGTYQTSLRSALSDDLDEDELNYALELLGDRQNGEMVNVANDEEAKKASAIIRRIYENYGIDVNSQAGVDAIRRDYDEVPQSVRDSLKTTAWEYKELVALEKALARFAPILGSARGNSTRSGEGQEIRTVSKVDQAIDENSDAGVLDTTTLGEYFESSENFSMFTAGESSTIDFADNDKQLEGTAIHEIAHGLMEYALDDYVAELEYWDSRLKASGKAGAEAPITEYGGTNAGEDLSEAVMYYFVDRNSLKNGLGAAKGSYGNPCPKRDAFIEKAIQDWNQQKAQP
ncbi:eCIS core domain-containing protein [Haliangium ochraceum]|uniref:Annexin repeat protein n=1 Tax=Haliangium ochraceum (strain DSM 14365 / JCM 11303 / SMP-2) TaxID=502025 RepID=D0LXT0_HALO1|nr:DUF4157 domain-containing protein [Haliangium ochraceum]ACY14285.1 Annexin repeat protein [Haliangium ochraceum DSM 14365]